ncbi:MAG TPA: hypothetical protein VFE62_00055 [Gemmataceae bacterium]|nr:hypothetical protein [Gemmataceae bacterium]
MATETTKRNEAWEQAKESGKESLAKGKEAGEQAMEAARQEGKGILDKAKDAACAVGKKAEDATAAAGHGIADFGERVSEKGPHSGFMGTASQKVGDTIKEGGRYIEEQKLSGMAHDVAEIVKNHPIPALVAVFGLGFMIGQAMKD